MLLGSDRHWQHGDVTDRTEGWGGGAGKEGKKIKTVTRAREAEVGRGIESASLERRASNLAMRLHATWPHTTHVQHGVTL